MGTYCSELSVGGHPVHLPPPAMTTLIQPEASAKPAWIMAIATTVRRVLVIVCIGGLLAAFPAVVAASRMRPGSPRRDLKAR